MSDNQYALAGDDESPINGTTPQHEGSGNFDLAQEE